METKYSNKLIKMRFESIHKEYCVAYKKFMNSMKVTFQEDLTSEEFENILDWSNDYEHYVRNAITTFEDFEEQIRNQTLELTPERIKENQIFDNLKNTFLPFAIMYWASNTSSFGSQNKNLPLIKD